MAIAKLRRRIQELEMMDVAGSVQRDTGAVSVAESNIRETIRDVFGTNSPEFKEHAHISIWAGPMFMGMQEGEIIECIVRGRTKVAGILNGLTARLAEKKADLTAGTVLSPSGFFDRISLHPRIQDVTRDLFMDGHPWEAVFAASKALVNYVKERSDRYELDGAPLMRDVFSRNDPVLAFNELEDQTDRDEQEGMMHLFEGAVLAIRNPGGHSFPDGSEQRAIEYIEFLSLLAYKVQESKKIR